MDQTIDSATPLRVALLGCGRIARLAHLTLLQRHPAARLVAVADVDQSARDNAARLAAGAEVFSDLHELLANTKPDAVVIALPTGAHRDAAVAALESGAHIYLEKPIAGSLAEARDIRAAWDPARAVARMGFNARFGKLYREMQTALQGGAIGEPVAVRTAFVARFPREATWRVSPSVSGGALLELASHHVDLLRFMFRAEIESVGAESWSNRGDDESAMIQLRLAGGLHAQIFVSYGTVEEDRFEIYGTEGKLTVDRYDSLVAQRTGPYARGGIAAASARLRSEIRAIGYGLEKKRAPGEEPSFRESIGDFIEAARSRRGSSPDLDDGMRAIEVIDAARRAAFERRTVAVGA
jgi:predicted dehydrogenase